MTKLKTSHTIIARVYTTGDAPNEYLPFNAETVKMIAEDGKQSGNGTATDASTVALALLGGTRIWGDHSTYELTEVVEHDVDGLFRYGKIRAEYISFYVDGVVAASFRQDTNLGDAYSFGGLLVANGRGGTVLFPSGNQMGIRESMADGPVAWMGRACAPPRDAVHVHRWWHRDHKTGEVETQITRVRAIESVRGQGGLAWYGTKQGELVAHFNTNELTAYDIHGPISPEEFGERWAKISKRS